MPETLIQEQERRQQAAEMLQVAIQTIMIRYGFAVEVGLQSEAIASSYMTTRATLVLRPLQGWQPPVLDPSQN